MTIHKIIGPNGVMPELCNGGTCPTALLVDNEDVVIQGYILTSDELAQLKGPAGEGFLKMPRAVFERIAHHVLTS